MLFQTIPVFTRFQWVNNPQVVDILSCFLQPPSRGRKGYDKVWMFRWLIYKWLMRCSYRDLESMTDIDYSTFVKFKKRLIASFLLPQIFEALRNNLVSQRESIKLILDSSFVQTYSRYDEKGSEYNGHKEKNGFKLHAIIDYGTRLPLIQKTTPGARHDVVWGENLIRGAPKEWNVYSLCADKGYDSESFVSQIRHKWKGIRVSIPLRRFSGDSWYNRWMKSRPRSHSKKLYKSRTEIERYFSRKKHVFHLGEERTRGLKSFEANCYLTSIMEYLEYFARVIELFTKLEALNLTFKYRLCY